MKLYVCNLDYELKEPELRDAFEKFGTVTSVIIIKDKLSGRSKGFGFIEMPNDSEANEAIKGLNEKELNKRKLLVSESKPRKDAQPFSSKRERRIK